MFSVRQKEQSARVAVLRTIIIEAKESELTMRALDTKQQPSKTTTEYIPSHPVHTQSFIMSMNIMILGGYGNAGRPIASLLLQEAPDVDILIAGRNLAAAQDYVDKLNEKYARDRAQARQVDASSPDSLDAAFRDIDMVVVASSTKQYTPLVVEAALTANIDYLDIQVTDSTQQTQVMESLKKRISTSTKCFVTQGGFHPGMPAALVKFAATQLHHVQKANVYCNMSPNWKELDFSDATKEEFFREMFDMKNDIYVHGKWEKQGWSVVEGI